MSCNLCLAWRAVEALDGTSLKLSSWEAWLRGEGWTERLKAQMN